jgi:hypothetical protein
MRAVVAKVLVDQLASAPARRCPIGGDRGDLVDHAVGSFVDTRVFQRGHGCFALG